MAMKWRTKQRLEKADVANGSEVTMIFLKDEAAEGAEEVRKTQSSQQVFV